MDITVRGYDHQTNLIDYNTLINLLKKQSFNDKSRNDILETIVNTIIPINLFNLRTLLKCYSFDDDKIKAVKILQNNNKLAANSDFHDIPFVLSCMSFEEGKIAMLKTLCNVYKVIDLRLITEIVQIFSFDDTKLKAFNTVYYAETNESVCTCNVVYLLRTFSFDDSRMSVMQRLKGCQIANKTELSNLLKVFSFDKYKVLKMIRLPDNLTTDDLAEIISNFACGKDEYKQLCEEFWISDDIMKRYEENVKSNSISFWGFNIRWG